MELLTAAQMRRVEHAAIEGGTVTGLELMERAGRGVVEAAYEEWPDFAAAPQRALVLCGPGNNGGDGFVVARLLRGAGWQVEVFLFGDADKLPPDAKANHDRWCDMGAVAAWDADAIIGAEADLCVDAVFGAGLTRPVAHEVVDPMVRCWGRRRRTCRALAIDAPTGLCMDSGRLLIDSAAGVPNADLTVTFHRARIGHYLASGPIACGKLRLKDIGLEPRFSGQGPRNRPGPAGLKLGPLVSPCRVSPQIDKGAQGQKYSHGHAVVLSGPMGRSGAARLAARGALRVGAGLVTVAAPGSAMMECATQLTAIMLRKCEDAEGLAALLEDDRINALCLGPGLGLERAKALVQVACGGVKPRPMVLDADALTAFAEDPDALFDMLHPDVILTPHEGEFARLFPDLSDRLRDKPTAGPAFSKVDAARAAAARAGCIVLLKGPDTVIAAPEGRTALNAATYDRAAPWLATAGAGDVLAGIITGLLARKLAPMQAAMTGAALHLEAALEVGPGLIAEDLPEQLPAVFRRLLAPDRR